MTWRNARSRRLFHLLMWNAGVLSVLVLRRAAYAAKQAVSASRLPKAYSGRGSPTIGVP